MKKLDAKLFHPNSDQDSIRYILSKQEFYKLKVCDGNKTYNGFVRKNIIGGPSPLIIMFVRNAQNSAQVMRYFDSLGMWRHFLDYNFLIMDYPGYGLSDGKPSASGIFREALLTYDYVSGLPYVDKKQIVIGGLSIGTGPAVYLAAKRGAYGLFLLAPYESVCDIHKKGLPIIRGPMRILAKHMFPSKRYAPSITSPVLIVASKDDKIVPFHSSKRLAAHFSVEPMFVALSGVAHNWIMSDNRTYESIQDFLSTLQ